MIIYHYIRNSKIWGLILITSMLFNVQASGQQASRKFIHPGMMQNSQDLAYMRENIMNGKQPWKNAFDTLKKNSPLGFKAEPQPHISVGPYGANSIGGREFSKSAVMAYNYALMWQITRKKVYADEAIAILNAWSRVLWDFDDNNAKLNVGLSGPYFLNAAEILKYSDSGWEKQDIEGFKRMVLTVFYPTIKDFFTEANGNWDASIINTLLCIGIFTDNTEIFNAAVNRYYHGPGNSGITKYIYPNGQIQETTRDWDHVQLGIGEFGKAAQVAWTQNVDFYGAADNRLALGFEYASKFMAGNDNIPVYGILSKRARDKFKDIYEGVFDHYTKIKGLKMPYTQKVITEHTRASSSIGALTGPRYSTVTARKQNLVPICNILPVAALVGALDNATVKPPADAIILSPGDSIQAALNTNAGKGKWIVLAKGVHMLKAVLTIPDGITLAGQGNQSILMLAPGLQGATVMNNSLTLHDVTIRDLLIEGAINHITNTDPNADRRIRSYMNAPSREGIIFSAKQADQMHNIILEHVTVQNFTKNGVSIRGAKQIVISKCNFSDNGASVVPGAGFHHNLHLNHASQINISNSRLDTSPWGTGIALSFCRDVKISGNEIARNKLSGISFIESDHILITGNLIEGNNENGIRSDDLIHVIHPADIYDNILDYNGKKAILLRSIKGEVKNNRLLHNGNESAQVK